MVVSVSILVLPTPSCPPYPALTHGANAFLKSPQPFGDDATCDEFARKARRRASAFSVAASFFLSPFEPAGKTPEAEEKPREISRGSRCAQLAVRAVIPKRVRGENSRELPRVFLHKGGTVYLLLLLLFLCSSLVESITFSSATSAILGYKKSTFSFCENGAIANATTNVSRQRHFYSAMTTPVKHVLPRGRSLQFIVAEQNTYFLLTSS